MDRFPPLTDSVITTLKQYYDSILPVFSISFRRYLPYVHKTPNFLLKFLRMAENVFNNLFFSSSSLLSKVASSIADLSRSLLTFENPLKNERTT